ncbi:MAG: purine-binding chemotaxis protein CheW [Candidatus Thermoplasmatota archaeon]|nr:purine-binding chemotaxis protein CheW [Candidatus Thermoplasmatota archaeon]
MPVGTDEKKSQQRTFDEKQLVVFKLGKEEFGVDINKVKEIIRWEDVTRIPNTSPYIKGVINLRGSIIVVNDLAMKLGLSSKEIDNDTRILVVEVGDNTVGMIVDSATEVLRLEGEKIRDAPSMITNTIDHNYIEGVGLLDEKRLLTLLDLGKVLESKDFEQIWQAQQIANQKMQKEKAEREAVKDKVKQLKKDETIKQTDESSGMKEKPEYKEDTKPGKKSDVQLLEKSGKKTDLEPKPSSSSNGVQNKNQSVYATSTKLKKNKK